MTEHHTTEAVGLLKYALHLRQHGEHAPGGNETWSEFDRRCEDFLRRQADEDAPSARPVTPQGGRNGSEVGRGTPGSSDGLETRSGGALRDITYEVPVVHCTPAEFQTELWWAEHVDPVAKLHGLADYVGLGKDPGDRDQHLLKDRDGMILLAVRIDRPEDA